MSIQSLVAAAQKPAVDIAGLWDTYNNMVFRSLAERMRLRRELATMGDGTVFDVMDLFRLPEAFGKDAFPLVGLAPINSTTVHYQCDEYATRFWTGKMGKNRKRKISKQLHIFRPNTSYHYTYTGSALVPFVPKSVAPGPLSRLVEDHWVMFDTPAWLDKKVTPVDPYLLKRLDKQRFRVLAHWDLTDKERQLMALIR